MNKLRPGKIKITKQYDDCPRVNAALVRLQQLGVSVVDSITYPPYDYELRLPIEVEYPQAVLVEIGFLLAQLVDHKFPEEYEGFSSTTGAVPHWKPKENLGTREGIRFDVDPAFMYFRFDLRR